MIERTSRISNHVLYRYEYPDKDLLESVHEMHFLDNEIISAACKYIKKYNIKRYAIYDYLLAYSMKFYGIDKIITLNKADFERYDFIKEIISPSS